MTRSMLDDILFASVVVLALALVLLAIVVVTLFSVRANQAKEREITRRLELEQGHELLLREYGQVKPDEALPEAMTLARLVSSKVRRWLE